MAICPRCHIHAEGHRCGRCGRALNDLPAPGSAPTEQAEGGRRYTELGWFARFCITLICSYIFTFLVVATCLRIECVTTIWFHLANFAIGIAGIFFFHQVTDYMRDYTDY
jgi:hypothetical protein